MSKKQRGILFSTAILIVVIVLFPPFSFEYPTRVVENLGYGFLFQPPKTKISSGYSGNVNSGLLMVEIFAAFLFGGVLVLAVKDKK